MYTCGPFLWAGLWFPPTLSLGSSGGRCGHRFAGTNVLLRDVWLVTRGHSCLKFLRSPTNEVSSGRWERTRREFKLFNTVPFLRSPALLKISMCERSLWKRVFNKAELWNNTAELWFGGNLSRSVHPGRSSVIWGHMCKMLLRQTRNLRRATPGPRWWPSGPVFQGKHSTASGQQQPRERRDTREAQGGSWDSFLWAGGGEVELEEQASRGPCASLFCARQNLCTGPRMRETETWSPILV